MEASGICGQFCFATQQSFPVKRFWGSGFCASAATNFEIKLSNYANDWTPHLWTPPLSLFSLLHFILMHLISVLIDLPPCSSLSCRTFPCHLCRSPFISPLHIPPPTDKPSAHLPLFALLFLLSFPSVISATFLLLVCTWRCCSTTKGKKRPHPHHLRCLHHTKFSRN